VNGRDRHITSWNPVQKSYDTPPEHERIIGDPTPIRLKTALILFALLIVAGAVRHVDIDYHSSLDQPFNVERARVFLTGTFLAKPERFKDSHIVWKQQLHFAQLALFVKAATLLTGDNPLDAQVIFNLGEWHNTLLGALTLLPIWLIARLFYGDWRQYLPPLVAAFIPGHAYNCASFQSVDTTAIFYFSFFVYYCFKSYFQTGAPRRNLILATVLLGLAGGVRFSYLLSFPAIVCLVALAETRRLSSKAKDYRAVLVKTLGKSSVLGLLVVAIFLATNPVLVSNVQSVVSAFLEVSQHMRSGHYGADVSWSYPFPRWKVFYQLFALGPFFFGVALYVFTLIGLALCFREAVAQRSLSLLVGAIVALPLCAAFSATVVSVRYVMFLVPLVSVFFVYTYDRIAGFHRGAGDIAAFSVVVYSALMTITLIQSISNDSRHYYTRELERIIPRTSSVGRTHGNDNPRVMYYVADFVRQRRAKDPFFFVTNFGPKTRMQPLTIAQFPDYLISSGMWTYREFRTGARGFFSSLATNNNDYYERIASFEAHYLNKPFYKLLDTMFANYFYSPDFMLYRLRRPFRDTKREVGASFDLWAQANAHIKPDSNATTNPTALRTWNTTILSMRKGATEAARCDFPGAVLRANSGLSFGVALTPRGGRILAGWTMAIADSAGANSLLNATYTDMAVTYLLLSPSGERTNIVVPIEHDRMEKTRLLRLPDELVVFHGDNQALSLPVAVGDCRVESFSFGLGPMLLGMNTQGNDPRRFSFDMCLELPTAVFFETLPTVFAKQYTLGGE